MHTWTSTYEPLFFAGPANPELASAVAGELGVTCAPCEFSRFPDGEVSVEIGTSVAGRNVVLLQPTAPPVNDHLMELLSFTDACRRASAESVTVVAPYFGYARSDRRQGRRVPVSASMVAELMRAVGVHHLLTLDVHSPQIEGFFRIPVDDCTAVPVLSDALARHVTDRSVIVAPDLGAVRLAEAYAQQLKIPVAVVHKLRRSATSVTSTGITGDVRGRSCMIVDDMITTGGTMEGAAHALREAGANESVVLAATHGVLTDSAWERLARVGVEELVVTDSVRVPPSDVLRRRVVSVAALLAGQLGRLTDERRCSGKLGDSRGGDDHD
jgi:ribose-phosphate pyrophosphokinase